MVAKYSFPFQCKNVEYFKTEEEQPTGMSYAEFTAKNYLTIKIAKEWDMRQRELSEDHIFMERCKQE